MIGIVGLAIACSTSAISLESQPKQDDYRLVWSDEFDRPGAPDPAKWTYEEGFIRNKELQRYTKDRRENARIEDGRLIIEARREGEEVTSASLITLGRADWRDAKFEVRAKVPPGKGTWPAIWLMGTSREKIGWPACGEIDIMEYVGHTPGKAWWTIHSQDETKTEKKVASIGTTTDVPNLAAEFHVYGLIKRSDAIIWTFDGKEVFRFEKEKRGKLKWVFDEPFYLLLNLAIGGTWGAQYGVDESIYPARFEVDWVRVYSPSPK